MADAADAGNEQGVVVYVDPERDKPVIYDTVYTDDQAQDGELRCAKKHPSFSNTVSVRIAQVHASEYPPR